jgi:hypothetical protein
MRDLRLSLCTGRLQIRTCIMQPPFRVWHAIQCEQPRHWSRSAPELLLSGAVNVLIEMKVLDFPADR